LIDDPVVKHESSTPNLHIVRGYAEMTVKQAKSLYLKRTLQCTREKFQKAGLPPIVRFLFAAAQRSVSQPRSALDRVLHSELEQIDEFLTETANLRQFACMRRKALISGRLTAEASWDLC
jgi:hypothetical protein